MFRRRQKTTAALAFAAIVLVADEGSAQGTAKDAGPLLAGLAVIAGTATFAVADIVYLSVDRRLPLGFAIPQVLLGGLWGVVGVVLATSTPEAGLPVMAVGGWFFGHGVYNIAWAMSEDMERSPSEDEPVPPWLAENRRSSAIPVIAVVPTDGGVMGGLSWGF